MWFKAQFKRFYFIGITKFLRVEVPMVQRKGRVRGTLGAQRKPPSATRASKRDSIEEGGEAQSKSRLYRRLSLLSPGSAHPPIVCTRSLPGRTASSVQERCSRTGPRTGPAVLLPRVRVSVTRVTPPPTFFKKKNCNVNCNGAGIRHPGGQIQIGENHPRLSRDAWKLPADTLLFFPSLSTGSNPGELQQRNKKPM